MWSTIERQRQQHDVILEAMSLVQLKFRLPKDTFRVLHETLTSMSHSLSQYSTAGPGAGAGTEKAAEVAAASVPSPTILRNMLPGTSILDVSDKLAGGSYLSDILIQPKNSGKFWEQSLS